MVLCMVIRVKLVQVVSLEILWACRLEISLEAKGSLILWLLALGLGPSKWSCVSKESEYHKTLH